LTLNEKTNQISLSVSFGSEDDKAAIKSLLDNEYIKMALQMHLYVDPNGSVGMRNEKTSEESS
jgi:hypothetical protein